MIEYSLTCTKTNAHLYECKLRDARTGKQTLGGSVSRASQTKLLLKQRAKSSSPVQWQASLASDIDKSKRTAERALC